MKNESGYFYRVDYNNVDRMYYVGRKALKNIELLSDLACMDEWVGDPQAHDTYESALAEMMCFKNDDDEVSSDIRGCPAASAIDKATTRPGRQLHHEH